MEICKRELCTGCSSCLNACPHDAIVMQPDDMGFYYPQIDIYSCVNCHLCQSVCPSNNSLDLHIPLAANIAQAKDEDEVISSTSGGLASAFSRSVIRDGGVVYGCSLSHCTIARHVRIEKLEDVDSLKGSKYVQSDIGKCYRLIKNDLIKGLYVLFIGTPCQVAGLRAFLRKEYVSLITVDIICHGVPSRRLLEDAIEAYIPMVNLKNVTLNFRRKRKMKSEYGLFVYKSNGEGVYEGLFPKNEYITGFLQALFYRDSCYHCLYAKSDRVSDITLGDYWDVEKKIRLKNHEKGLSMLIINTQKGKEFVEQCSELIEIITDSYENFVDRNAQLRQPMPRHKHFMRFQLLYPKAGFVRAAHECLKEDVSRIRLNMFLTVVSRIVYMIPGTRLIYNKIVRR